MPSPSERSRNNIRTGVFVSVSLVLALGIIVVLSDAVERLTVTTDRYTASFPLRSGVGNLSAGSEVRVGGVRLGEVVRVQPRYDDVLEEIDVMFSLRREVRLYADAQVLVSSPLIGAEAWLDIPSVGTSAAGPPPDSRLAGTESIGMLTGVLGSENAARADEMMASAQRFMRDAEQLGAFLATLPDEYEARVGPILVNLEAATEQARLLLTTIRQDDWPRWAGDIDGVLRWANEATGRLDAILAEGHGILLDSRQMLGEQRPKIEQTIENIAGASEHVKQIARQIDEETIQRAHALLESGQSALDQASAVIASLHDDYDGWAVNVGEALANANLTGQQLRLAATEVRRNPWKLLHTPSPRELEHELLYESARSFAVAAADLKAASASVQRVLDRHGDRLDEEPETVQRITETLLDPLERYERAQARLLDVLFESPR